MTKILGHEMKEIPRKTLLLIPMKDPAKSKTRLTNVLNLRDRIYLARSLFSRTLLILKNLVNEYPNLYLDLAVVSASDEIIEFAENNGSISIQETGNQSLRNAAEIAKKWAVSNKYRSICILPADLANPEPKEIVSFIKESTELAFTTISPSADLGTNALHISLPTDFKFCYGDKSFLRHLEASEKIGLSPKILPLPSLKYDIDTSEDLQYLKGIKLET